MTLTRFVTRNAFRNKRRSLLTVLSITFSLLLLTIMMSLWQAFYLEKGNPTSAERLVTRHRVSLYFNLPLSYREKIRAIPGVVAVAPTTWFGGIYKDNKPENTFSQFATDPAEYLKVASDRVVPPEQVEAWQRDRTGALVDVELAKKHGWKLGDRVFLKGRAIPVDLELTIRAMYTAPRPNYGLYFNKDYLEEAAPRARGRALLFFTRVQSPEMVAGVSQAIDEMFRNSPQPTKSESQDAFQIGMVALLGNVKAFILSICAAVVFAILLVSANTMAMSIRERTREVALLKTLGFTCRTIVSLFVGEAVTLSLVGGLLGILVAVLLTVVLTDSPVALWLPGGLKVAPPAMGVALLVAALVGFVSSFLPSYNASRGNIVEGLRHVG